MFAGGDKNMLLAKRIETENNSCFPMLRKRESEMQRVECTCVGVRERGWRPRVRGMGMADSYMDWLVYIVRGLEGRRKKKGEGGGKGEREKRKKKQKRLLSMQ